MGFPLATRTGWPAVVLTILFFMFIDAVIDPVALRGDRWFLGRIYYYPDPGTHFGIPIANYIGWAVVGFLSLRAYLPLDRKLQAEASPFPAPSVTGRVLLGCGLYYGVLIFQSRHHFLDWRIASGSDGLVHLYTDHRTACPSTPGSLAGNG